MDKKTYHIPAIKTLKIAAPRLLEGSTTITGDASGNTHSSGSEPGGFDSKGYAGGIEFDDDEVGGGAGAWE